MEVRDAFSSRSAVMPDLATLAGIDAYAAEASARGVDYLSIRRLAELTSATDAVTATELRRLLAADRPSSYDPPLYHT